MRETVVPQLGRKNPALLGGVSAVGRSRRLAAGTEAKTRDARMRER